MFLKKKNLIKQFITLVLVTSLSLNPLFTRMVLADTMVTDTTATPTPTPDPTPTVIDSVTPSPGPDPSPSPSPDPTPDISPSPSPTPDISPSPEPTVTPSPSPDTTVQALTLSPDPSPSPDPSSSPSASPDPSPSPDPVVIQNINQGVVDNNVDSNAQTGSNTINNGSGANLTTGQAVALANLLTLLNTSIVGANFQLFFLNQATGESGQIDLNQLWTELQNQASSDNLLINGLSLGNLLFFVQNNNDASLNNQVNVSAQSGNNQASQNGNVNINTGDAIALANVLNLVNTNIVGTQFFLAIINLLGNQTGDLILPRPDKFLSDSNSQTLNPPLVNNQNQSNVSSSVNSEALTGQNSQQNNAGSNALTTGNATSRSNIFSLISWDMTNNNWFFLLINNLGNWSGQILDWTPGGVQSPTIGSQVFQTGSDSPGLTGNNVVQNNNSAQVNNNIQAQASTGGNGANNNFGNTTIRTGNATALANLINFINLNIVGGHWFFGLVNILGNWTGNAIFAYPELAVSLSQDRGTVNPGDKVNYNVTVTNRGHDDASSATVNLTLPQGLNYLSDSSGQDHGGSGQNLSWSFDKLRIGQTLNFTVSAQVDPGLKPGEELSWFSRLIPKAYAAESGPQTDLVVNTSVSTPDPQSDTSQNSSSVTTVVVDPSQSVSDSQPNLEISGWNNVGAYVYPGDTITYQVTVKNNGAGRSHNTVLHQQLFNENGTQVGSADINLGTIEGGKGLKVTFGLSLPQGQSLPSGNYYTLTQAQGTADNGNGVTSNQIRNDFLIAAQSLLSPGVVQAAGKEENILGANTSIPPKDQDILPYFLLFLLSSAYILSRTRPTLGLGKEQA